MKYGTCTICNRKTEIIAKGLCNRCYGREHYYKNRIKLKAYYKDREMRKSQLEQMKSEEQRRMSPEDLIKYVENNC